MDVPERQVLLWAVTRVGEAPTDDEKARRADWNAATFTPLEQVDAQLAEQFAGVLVAEFLSHGELSALRADEALASVRIRRGVTPSGTLILAADLPLGEGHREYEWDGSHAQALEIAADMGQTAGQNVSAERAIVGPTGWEPEYDGTHRRT